MAYNLDSKGNVIEKGFSTNMSPSQYDSYLQQDASNLIPKEDLASFKKANPNLNFTNEDYQHYNNNIIPASSLNTQVQTPKIPTPTAQTNYNQMTTDITSPYVEQLSQENQQLKTQQSNDANSIRNLMTTLSGKSAFEAEQNQTTGLNQSQQDYLAKQAELSALNKQAAAAQQENIAQGRQLGSVASFVAGQGNEIERNRAIRALTIGAELDALKGNIDVAQMKVKQAVDAKYAGVEQDLKNRLQMFDLNSKLIQNRSEAEQKAWERAKYATEQAQKKLDEQKKTEEDIGKILMDARAVGTSDSKAAADRAQKIFEQGGSKLAVIQALGKYGGDYLGNLVKLSTIAKNNKDYEKTVEEIKALKTPLQNNAPAGSNAYSTNSWVNSAVNKESLSAGEREKVSKSFAVVGQLGNLATALQKDQTSFFGGKVKEIKAALGADASAGAIQAQITALVPQVARGTFGEVGVLTDADISNYKKVIGNLSSPNAQNAAVTAMTLTALRNGVKAQLDTAAASKLDVSRFVPMYQDLTNQINKINDDIGVTDQQVRDYMLKNPQTQPMIEQLIVDGRKGSEILQILGVEN